MKAVRASNSSTGMRGSWGLELPNQSQVAKPGFRIPTKKASLWAVKNHLSTELALGCGGDRDRADWRHFARLAGFTNQKGSNDAWKWSSAVRQAAQQRRERLLSGERLSSRGGSADARKPFATRASRVGAPLGD
ncbi:MAG: hypothetical protein JO121_09570 [Deltaproteobacteria bacterium]|nr:hypothetical protein [Deltaproteobacteria bacterium]